jgi:hypothetical protein
LAPIEERFSHSFTVLLNVHIVLTHHSLVGSKSLADKLSLKPFSLLEPNMDFKKLAANDPWLVPKRQQVTQTLLGTGEQQPPVPFAAQSLHVLKPLQNDLLYSLDIGLDLAAERNQELGAFVVLKHIRVVAVARHALLEDLNVFPVELGERLLEHLRQLGQVLQLTQVNFQLAQLRDFLPLGAHLAVYLLEVLVRLANRLLQRFKLSIQRI